ncbi:MAG: amphi-Trp domain-containing protein [Thermodesulfobacteriota bacterium]
MTKEKMAIEGTLDFAAAATLLDELAKSYREKTICIEKGEECICLTPGEYVEVEVEAAIKKGKQKVSIELSWKEELLSEEAKLKISSRVPEARLVPPGQPCGTSEGGEEKQEAAPAAKKCDVPEKTPEVKEAAKGDDKGAARDDVKAKGKDTPAAHK